MGISKRKREQILERDSGRCMICESDTQLEVHHILGIAESRKKGLPKQSVNHQGNLVTMCRRCHSLTYGNRKLQYWLTREEANELRSISFERKQLSKEREELKMRYQGMWNASSYTIRKREIGTEFKKLDQREEEIRGVARQRLATMQDEVLKKITGYYLESEKAPNH